MTPDWSPLWLALRAAALATALALALGPWLGYLLMERRALALAGLPLSFATAVLAAYALLAAPFEWPMGALVALAYSLPCVVRASATAFARLNPDYLRAARGLGASEWLVFRRVAVPLAWGPILAAGASVFAVIATDYALLLALARGLRAGVAVSAAPAVAAAAIGLAVHALGSRLERGAMV